MDKIFVFGLQFSPAELIAVVFSAIALLVSFYSFWKNRFRIKATMAVTEYSNRAEAIPYIYGIFSLVNYSNQNCNILSVLVYERKFKYFCKRGSFYEVIKGSHDSFSHTPIHPRDSSATKFIIHLPPELVKSKLIVKLYTTHRRRAYRGKFITKQKP